MTPPIVIAMGDPAGIGPEIITALWSQRHALNLPPFVVAGARWAFPPDLTPLLTGDFAAAEITPGQPSTEAARAAWRALDIAIDMALAGEARALVTAPVAKSSLYAIGFPAPGQTEYLAARCGVTPDDAVMLLAGPQLRTVPLTIHIPYRDVPALLSRALIVQRASVVASALQRDFGIAKPRLVLAGLNPHAGEEGSIGHEDAEILAPAIMELRSAGMDIRGPLSADTLFHARARATYDVALCPTHDQALIPVKTLDFDEGVNVTLGLPIVRTSPDHGTAFDIAGRGRARCDAMAAALRMADMIATRRLGHG